MHYFLTDFSRFTVTLIIGPWSTKIGQIDIFSGYKPCKNETGKSNSPIDVVTDDEGMSIVTLILRPCFIRCPGLIQIKHKPYLVKSWVWFGELCVGGYHYEIQLYRSEAKLEHEREVITTEVQCWEHITGQLWLMQYLLLYIETGFYKDKRQVSKHNTWHSFFLKMLVNKSWSFTDHRFDPAFIVMYQNHHIDLGFSRVFQFLFL